MKCEKCKNEATVHEVRIKSGKRLETHLCESCAKDQGLSVQTPTPITHLLTQFITSQSMGAEEIETAVAAGGALSTVCPVCGTTYAQFRSSGLLGCEECYATFEAQLSPLIARAHEGGVQHTGKSPRGRIAPAAPARKSAAPPAALPATPAAKPKGPSIAEQAALLRTGLEAAVAKEQYEHAARLRDELARLEGRAKASRAKRADRASKDPDRTAGEERP